MNDESKSQNHISPINIIQSSARILTKKSYNPFSPNEDENPNSGDINKNKDIKIIRPYLNEIQNEGPKNTNDNNNEENNKINIDDEIALAHKQSEEMRIKEQMAVDYENALKEEIEQKTPLISEKIDIQNLMKEYESNEEYINSVKVITEKYKYIRKVRRDGNCFYRAFIYRLFEYICIKNDTLLYNHILKKIEEIKELSAKNGYDWMIVEDFYTLFYGEFCSCYNAVNNNGISVRDYIDNLFKDQEKGNYLIYFIRFCIAAYLRENRLLYEVYIEGDFDHWIVKEVEAPNNEADQIQIMACVNYFEIGVKIEYLNKYKNEVVKFPEDKKDEDFFIEVLFTPGHYDILYH